MITQSLYQRSGSGGSGGIYSGSLARERTRNHSKYNKNDSLLGTEGTTGGSGGFDIVIPKKEDWLTNLTTDCSYMQYLLRSSNHQTFFGDFTQVNGINSPLPEDVCRKQSDHRYNT